MPENVHFEDTREETAARASEILSEKAKRLGQIMQNHPQLQSNSPELYMLAYLTELGLAKI